MQARIAKTFENIYSKYNKVMSLKELNDFASQLSEHGFDLAIDRKNNKINAIFETAGSMDYFKRICANELNIDLKLRPYQNYLYR